ncbi:MAG: alpha/beta hydrolase, partial [Alphaproteobacteria bacterium]|nr:alpha/beta hydrolase [Alphaproteobacteria bacterium]
LLIAGGADRMTPPRIGEALAKAITGARMEVFPDTGHMIMVERPNATTDSIHRFLASV